MSGEPPPINRVLYPWRDRNFCSGRDGWGDCLLAPVAAVGDERACGHHIVSLLRRRLPRSPKGATVTLVEGGAWDAKVKDGSWPALPVAPRMRRISRPPARRKSTGR